MINKKRNGQIEIYRWIFISLICLLHFGSNTDHQIVGAGYIGVEFFFVIAGFYLAQNSQKKKINAFKYTKNIIRKIFPLYAISILLILLYRIIVSFINMNGVIEFLKGIANDTLLAGLELSMLQMLGYSNTPINAPLWYVSVLIICSYFIWYFYNKDKKFFINVISPIIILICISILTNANQGLDLHRTRQLFVYDGIYRGLLDMTIGVIAYNIYEYLKKKKILNKIKVINLLEILGILYLVIHIIYFRRTNFDFIALAIITYLIIIANLKVTKLSNLCEKIYAKTISKIDPNYIFMVYACDVFVLSIYLRYILNNLNISYKYHVILFMFLSFIIPAIIMLLINIIKKLKK